MVCEGESNRRPGSMNDIVVQDADRQAPHPGDRPHDGRAVRCSSGGRTARPSATWSTRSSCRARRSTASSTRCSTTTWCAAPTTEAYRLGPRLLALAARTHRRRAGLRPRHPVDAASRRGLSEQTGEGSKVSVLDGDGVLVVAAVQGSRDYALTVVPGQRLPLHAGAASKVLLAAPPEAELHRLLGEPLVRYTSQTHRRPQAPLGRARQDQAPGLGAGQGRICAEHPRLRRADPRPQRPR